MANCTSNWIKEYSLLFVSINFTLDVIPVTQSEIDGV